MWLVASILDSTGLLHLLKAYYMPGPILNVLSHLNLRRPLGLSTIIMPIFQTSKLRYREVK